MNPSIHQSISRIPRVHRPPQLRSRPSQHCGTSCGASCVIASLVRHCTARAAGLGWSRSSALLIFAGGTSVSWACSYPFETAKTLYQTAAAAESLSPEKASASDAAGQHTHKCSAGRAAARVPVTMTHILQQQRATTGGWGFLYRGFPMVVVRAFPRCTVTMWAYDSAAAGLGGGSA